MNKSKNSGSGVVGLIFFLALAALVAIGIHSYMTDRAEQERLAGIWTVVAEGVYDHADYGVNVEVRHNSHGTDREIRQPFTAVYFDDGRTCVMEGDQYAMSFPRGTAIIVKRNGLGRYLIENK